MVRTGGGRPGVSDTMAGALWVLDYMFTLAQYGCAGVNTETGVNQLDFISSYSPIGDDEHGHHLWLYTEEYGEPSRVAHLVQMFLSQFRPHECWSLTYATSCSKPRLGEFAGGALFVTAADIQVCDAYDFINQQHAAFSAATTSLSERTPA